MAPNREPRIRAPARQRDTAGPPSDRTRHMAISTKRKKERLSCIAPRASGASQLAFRARGHLIRDTAGWHVTLGRDPIWCRAPLLRQGWQAVSWHSEAFHERFDHSFGMDGRHTIRRRGHDPAPPLVVHLRFTQ